MINKLEAICTNMYNKCPLQKNKQQMELDLVDFGGQKKSIGRITLQNTIRRYINFT